MSVYKEMDPILAWKLIEGHENVIDGPIKVQELFYRQFECPRCRIQMSKEVRSTHVFSDPSSIAPRSLLRCPNCRYLLDPHSGLILETGDAYKTPHGIIPTIG